MKKLIIFALIIFFVAAMTDMASAISPPGDPNAPERPVLSSPTHGLTSVSLTPQLQTKAFSDPNPGDTHAETQWQISMESSFLSLVIDVTSTSNLTSFIVPDFVLNIETTSYWRVRFYDNHNVESQWSDRFSFTTARHVEDTIVYASHVVKSVGGPIEYPGREEDYGVHALGPPNYEEGGSASGWAYWGGYMILSFETPVRDLEGVDLIVYHWGPGSRDPNHSTSFVYVNPPF